MHRLLLLLPRRLHGRQMLRLLALRSWSQRSATRTERHLRSLLTRLRRVCAIRPSERLSIALLAQWTLRWHLVKAHTHRRRHSNRVRIVVSTTLNPIARRQEGVEALDEVWIARKERADPSNHSRSVDGATLKVLHDVQESVVHVRLVGELHFHLVKIRQGVVQYRLLTLALPLRLLSLLRLLLLLLRGLLGLRAGCKWHQHALLHLLTVRPLRLGCWLHCTTREDVLRATRRTHRQLWLWLRSRRDRVVQHTVRSQRSSRPNCHRLVQWHWRTRRTLVWWRLLKSLPLLLLSSSVFLFLDLDLLLFSRSFALPLRNTRLPSRVTEAR